MGTISSDGLGYYSYLPAAFIYHDWTFDYYQNIQRTYHGNDSGAPFLNCTEHGCVDKYFAGEALLLSPFFAMACVTANILDAPVDGYGPVFQVFVSIGALFYLLVGLYMLYAFLCSYFSKQWSAVVCALLVLGSNLFYYAVFEPAAVHTYAFAVVCAFLWCTRKVLQGHQHYYGWSALCAGLLFVLRPSDLLVAFAVPFIAGSGKAWLQWWKGIWNVRTLVTCLLLMLLPIGFQSAAYFLQTGKWWIYAYGGETFHFDQPHFFEVLFGFRVGLLVYSPILLFALIGWWKWRKQQAFAAYAWLLFIVLNTYIISSWWAWHYEGAFGMRPYIDFLGVFALPMAVFFSSLKRTMQWVMLAPVAFIIYLVQFQAWQRFEVIIPWSHMDFAKHKSVFFRRHTKYMHLYTDKDFPGLPSDTDSLSFQYLIEKEKSTNGHSVFLHLPPKQTALIYTQRLPGSEASLLQIDVQGLVTFDRASADIELVTRAFRRGERIAEHSTRLLQFGASENDPHYFYHVHNFSGDRLEADSIAVVLGNNTPATVDLRSMRILEAWQKR